MSKCHYIPQCGSTNDEIVNFLSLENFDIFTLYTFDQTNGRGQYGNVWRIKPNQNIAFSMAINQDKINLSDSFLNFYTANILKEFIAKKTGFETKVKWPNDIIISGKKVSGMLIEKKRSKDKLYFIIGIGVNILQKNFAGITNAGSIFSQTNQIFDLKIWAEEMHNFLEKKIFIPPTIDEILTEYNQNLFKKDEISVFEYLGKKQNGIIQKVDEQGYIWIELEQEGLKKFYHKEITMLY